MFAGLRDVFGEILAQHMYNISHTAATMTSEHQPDIKPLSDPDNPFNRIITELRQNWRVEHPTNLELALLEFAKDDAGVPFDDLKRFCINAEDPDHATRILIGKLNSKLEPYGLKIRRRSLYKIAPIDTPTEE